MDNIQGHKFKLELLIQKLSNLLEIYINRDTLTSVVGKDDLVDLKKKIDEFASNHLS